MAQTSPYLTAALLNPQSMMMAAADPSLATIQPQLSLSQALLQQGANTSPIMSPWQGVGRLASALAGTLMQRNAYKALTNAQAGAGPEIAAAMHSPDPVSTLASSPNPYARMMALQLAPTLIEKRAEPYSLRRGEQRFGPDGKPIAANTAPNTQLGQLIQERDAIAAQNPNDPRIATYNAQIAKANQEGGYVYGANGATAVAGGPASPQQQAALAAAKVNAENPGLIARAAGTAAATAPIDVAKAAGIARATAPYQTTSIPPGAAVVPKSSVLGIPAPALPTAPGDAATGTVSNSPSPAVPNASAGTPATVGASSPSPTPQAPAQPGAPNAASGTPNLVKLPGGGIANTASPLTVNLPRVGATGVVETQAKLDAQAVDEARKKAQAGYPDVQTIRMIQDFLPKVATGWGAETKLEAARILKAAGVPDQTIQNSFLNTDVASGQLLTKQFLTLSSQAVRGMGAREPGSVISLFSKAYPNLGTDPKAITLQTNALLMQHKMDQDYADAKEDYLNQSVGQYQEKGTYRGLTGFERQFRKTNDPVSYMHAAEAMSGAPEAWKNAKTPDQQDAIFNLIPSGSTFIGPDGQMRVKP